jgi:hypothetical protein
MRPSLCGVYGAMRAARAAYPDLRLRLFESMSSYIGETLAQESLCLIGKPELAGVPAEQETVNLKSLDRPAQAHSQHQGMRFPRRLNARGRCHEPNHRPYCPRQMG